MKQTQTKVQERRIIGLDMHPDVFTAAALIGRDALSAKQLWIHHRVMQNQLEKWLYKYVRPTDLMVIEASANTFSVVERIEKAGCQVVVLESQRAGKIGKTYCNNDKFSAVKLARIYLSGLATTVWKPDPTTRARREIFHAHHRAVKDTTRSRNRIKSFLNEHSVRLPKGFELTNVGAKDQIFKLREWSSLQKMILTQECESLCQSEARRKQLRQTMAQEIFQDPKLLKLLRLFGLRHITVFALAAFIGDIARFRTPKQLVAYIGVNPSVDESGNTEGGTSLKKHGCSQLRSLLVQAAQAILRYPSPLQKWGAALAFRRGKHRAIIAVARKLVVACWYLMQGFFTPLQEISSTIKTKIQKLANIIGFKQIKAWGFTSTSSFIEQKCNQLLNLP